MAMINDVSTSGLIKDYSQIVLPQSSNVQEPKAIGTGQSDEKPAYIVDVSTEAKDKNAKASGQKDAKDTAENKDAKDTTSTEFWRQGKSKQEQKSIENEVFKLKQINQEVIAHEQAHKSTGGQYAGAVSYEKTTGPDGKQYIVGGEVSIDISSETTPQKTIIKMQIVRSAALAPASPSGQDRSVAAAASSIQMQAQSELAKQTSEKASKAGTGQSENKIDEKRQQAIGKEDEKLVEIAGKQKEKKNQFWMEQFFKKQQNSKNTNIGSIIDLSA